MWITVDQACFSHVHQTADLPCAAKYHQLCSYKTTAMSSPWAWAMTRDV